VQSSGLRWQDCSFETAGVSLEGYLRALIEACNAERRSQGSARQRRRVPKKQETLIRRIAEVGTIEIHLLMETFPKEWEKILSKHKGDYILIPKREFFRNMADMVARINSPLVTAYRNPMTCKSTIETIGGGPIVLVVDHHRLCLGWAFAKLDSKDFEGVPVVEGGAHCNLTGRSSQEPVPIPEAVLSQEAAGSLDQVPITDSPSFSKLPDEVCCISEPDSVASVIEVEIDDITGYWKVFFLNKQITFVPDLGYVQVGTCLLPFPDILKIGGPEELDETIIKRALALRTATQ